MRLTNLSFEDWVEHAFSHEVRFRRPAWFSDPTESWWDPTPADAVKYLTRLFEDAASTLRWFSDDQIAQGLTYLVSTSASGDNGWLYAAEVPIVARTRCIEAIGKLFEQLFLPRCTPHLSHLSEAPAGTLNCVCYMWWDEFPCIALPNDPDLQLIEHIAMKVMERILGLRSLACQESALHGLGHWHSRHPSEVACLVDQFLGSNTDVDPRLRTYANSARCGCVL